MLLRYDPFRDMERQFDRMFRDSAPAIPLDASRRDDDFIVEMDLPGVRPDSIDITVERNVLTVSAERRSRRGDDWEPLISERRHGTFRRELYLGQGLDTSKVEADYTGGVLTLTIPVAETSKPRKVSVTSKSGSGEHSEPVEVTAESHQG